jgi:peptidoglycan/LPS O-acetylase OafA/YrhL
MDWTWCFPAGAGADDSVGPLRLVLALLVLLSHADVRMAGINPGVSAVIGFYLISGYVMAGLVHRHYDQPHRIPLFYADRLLRLFPQYLAYMAAGLAWHLWTNTPTMYLTRSPTWLDLFNNIAILPLNFYMYNGSDAYTLVPPAWSLGAELQFYLIAPAMLLWPRVGLVLAAASLAVQGLALHGWLNTDWYGYRLLPGVLWVFGVGMLMFHLVRHAPQRARWLAWSAPVIAGVVYLYLRWRGLHAAPNHQEVLIGWGVGIPLLYWVAHLKAGRLGALAGDVSYGVFLNHFLIMWVLFPTPNRSALQLAMLALCSCLLSWATQRWLERPVLGWRRRLRVEAQH